MLKSKQKWLSFICILFIQVLVLNFPALGDMGPKPEINITVINFPEGEYYLDLMIENQKSEYLYDNFQSAGKKADMKLVEKMKEGCEEGWHLGLIQGTNRPMSGSLTGVSGKEGMVHRFGYMGVPDTFRIIVADQNGNIQISEIYKKKTFYSEIEYDYLTNTLMDKSPVWKNYLKQFFGSCIPTLVLEGLLLFLFGFSTKKNWKIFFVTNIITQILLTAIVGSALLKSGFLFALLVLVPVEIAIMIGESAVYACMLEKHRKGRKIAYGVMANLFSWLIGFFLILTQEAVTVWMR